MIGAGGGTGKDLADRPEPRPTRTLGIRFGPGPGRGNEDVVRPLGCLDYLTSRGNQQPLGAGGTDVNPEYDLHPRHTSADNCVT